MQRESYWLRWNRLRRFFKADLYDWALAAGVTIQGASLLDLEAIVERFVEASWASSQTSNRHRTLLPESRLPAAFYSPSRAGLHLDEYLRKTGLQALVETENPAGVFEAKIRRKKVRQ